MGSRLDHIIKENLARLRKLTGMSQIDFAKAVGIEPNTYWNLEKGKTTIVNENLVVIASGHYNLFDSERSKHSELTAQNRVLIRNLCHALWVFLRDYTHPVAKATVKNQCFHTYN